jgi:hypothetical protein
MIEMTCLRCGPTTADHRRRNLCRRCYNWAVHHGRLADYALAPSREVRSNGRAYASPTGCLNGARNPHGYTPTELANLNQLVCSLGPWRPARWAWDTPVPRDTVA